MGRLVGRVWTVFKKKTTFLRWWWWWWWWWLMVRCSHVVDGDDLMVRLMMLIDPWLAIYSLPDRQFDCWPITLFPLLLLCWPHLLVYSPIGEDVQLLFWPTPPTHPPTPIVPIACSQPQEQTDKTGLGRWAVVMGGDIVNDRWRDSITGNLVDCAALLVVVVCQHLVTVVVVQMVRQTGTPHSFPGRHLIDQWWLAWR